MMITRLGVATLCIRIINPLNSPVGLKKKWIRPAKEVPTELTVLCQNRCQREVEHWMKYQLQFETKYLKNQAGLIESEFLTNTVDHIEVKLQRNCGGQKEARVPFGCIKLQKLEDDPIVASLGIYGQGPTGVRHLKGIEASLMKDCQHPTGVRNGK